ncbi:MAG: aldo/keto reductase [Caldilineaceae bacterium]
METVQLGKTGATVSRLGFGGAPAGLTNYLVNSSPANAAQRAQTIAAIHRAAELGVTFFDTAAAYGRGASEEIYGEALASVTTPVFVATKASPSVENVRASLEASLTRLHRDQVDLFQIHGTNYDEATVDAILAPGGMLEQVEQLKAEGLTRFIGFTSEDNNPPFYRLMATGRFDVVQMCYNFAFQHPYDASRPAGSLLEAAEQKLGVITMRALTAGLLQKWVQMVNPANTFDYTPALLQYVLSNPLVHVALVGMRTPEEVEKNVAIVNDKNGRIDLNELHRKFF